jgi:hypothetical protein
MFRMMNPKDSNIYRQSIFRLTYDSFGVERVYEHPIFYKHTIPIGIGFAKIL